MTWVLKRKTALPHQVCAVSAMTPHSALRLSGSLLTEPRAMKRSRPSSSRLITGGEATTAEGKFALEYDEYGHSRTVAPIQTARTFRQIDFTRLKQPITLPKWSRNGYRHPQDAIAVPQLAPEIRVLPLDDFLMYEGAEGVEEGEEDPDGQVDVVALEEPDASAAEEGAPPPSKKIMVKEETNADLVEEDLLQDINEQAPQRKSERYRILRRPQEAPKETLAARARRENRTYDPLMAELTEKSEFVQEEVEVVEEEDSTLVGNYNYFYTPNSVSISRRGTYNDPRAIVNVAELYDEMARCEPSMTEETFNDAFGSEMSMAYPLNVKALMGVVKESTPQQNAKLIAALAMQMNFLKREMSKLREEIVDTRSASLMRQNYGLTGRTFDLNAPVTRNWFIPEQPPLRSVDLVQTARDVGLRIGRKALKNRDIIIRFVRAVFEQMIPTDRVREFTVRDRPSTRGQVLDIGIAAKDQIIGIVLDLLGLYEVDVLNHHSRVDRANFSDFVNQAMKTVMYDMRRISPKTRRNPNTRMPDVEVDDVVDE